MPRTKIPLHNYYYVDNAGCWIFRGAINRDGYGQMTASVLAHRRFYEAYVEPIPVGQMVLHRCDVRACVNPKHLYVGDAKQNAKDALDRGRVARGERNGNSKLTYEQAREIRSAPGKMRDIAAKYGITHRLVILIKRGEIWKEQAA